MPDYVGCTELMYLKNILEEMQSDGMNSGTLVQAVDLAPGKTYPLQITPLQNPLRKSVKIINSTDTDVYVSFDFPVVATKSILIPTLSERELKLDKRQYVKLFIAQFGAANKTPVIIEIPA